MMQPISFDSMTTSQSDSFLEEKVHCTDLGMHIAEIANANALTLSDTQIVVVLDCDETYRLYMLLHALYQQQS